jgi:L-alanine-DL-glutamate epimerase-like enolase superfamily enzyme
MHLATSGNIALVQETVRAFYSEWYQDLLSDVPRVEGGFVYPLTGPGLGTKLCPELLERPDVQRAFARPAALSR